MIHFLIKSPSITRLYHFHVFFLFFIFPVMSYAAKLEYSINFDAKYGVHTVGPPDMAVHRYTLEIEQRYEFDSNWLAVFGARDEVEASFASQPGRYSESDLAHYETQSFFIRDAFLQYKFGSLRVRAGNQQVVWGEAFGFYYADIVNPKDLREVGLGDLSYNRLSIPMLNTQFILSDSSFQFLYIPSPRFNIMPRRGSDFNSLDLSELSGATQVNFKRDPLIPITRGEYGFRMTKQFGDFDLSAFYLNYFDRSPVYRLSYLDFPSSITVYPDYSALQTIGSTLTVDLNGFLFRAEALQHQNREFNTMKEAVFSSAKSNEFIYVLGLDLPSMNKWLCAFQFSESRIKNDDWAFRKNSQDLGTFRLSKSITKVFGFETTYAKYFSDQSQLVQASFSFANSSRTEFTLGGDIFIGKTDTEFGRFKDASRVWLKFKTSLRQ